MSPLPCILCLHGGGSSSTIFKIQARRLINQLAPHFRFIFVDGPHECPAGPGILPTFENIQPYHRWYLGNWNRISSTDYHLMPKEEVDAVDSVILRAMEETEGGVGSFVGVMGFSQGARMAAGLMLRQQRLMPGKANKPLKGCRLKFGVLIAGPYPPITMADAADEPESHGDYAPLQTIPTVHAWGRDDQFHDRITRMADCCDSTETFILEYPGGHHMPTKHEPGATSTLADYILEASRTAIIRRPQRSDQQDTLEASAA